MLKTSMDKENNLKKSGFATKREAQFAERERALTQCSGESEITLVNYGRV